MIRFFLLLLLIVFLGWYVASSMQENGAGFVWIYYNQYSIETSFWFFLALLLVIFFAGHILFYLVTRHFGASWLLNKLGLISGNFGRKQQQKLLYKGQLAFVEQQWLPAYRSLNKYLKKNDNAIAALMAVKAAANAKQWQEAEHGLVLARKAPNADAVQLLSVELDILEAKADHGLLAQRIAESEKLINKNTQLQKQVLAYYCSQEQWRKAEILQANNATDDTAKVIYWQRISESYHNKSYDEVHEYYAKLNRCDSLSDTELAQITTMSVDAYIQHKDYKKADKAVELAIKNNRYQGLIDIFSQLNLAEQNLSAWLKALKNKEQDDALYWQALALCHQALSNEQEAIQAYEKSLALQSSNSAALALVALYEKHGQQDSVASLLKNMLAQEA